MGSSLIGSPLLSTIRTAGYRSSLAGFWFNTTHPVWPALSAIAPRACRGALGLPSVWGVTVLEYPFRATSVVSVVKTTFLTVRGDRLLPALIEFSHSLPSLLLPLLQFCQPEPSGVGLFYRVWTLPAIMQPGRNRKRERSFDG